MENKSRDGWFNLAPQKILNFLFPKFSLAVFILPLSSTTLEMSYTAEQLEATLHSLDLQIKEGIIEGNIHNVMAERTPDIVGEITNHQNVYSHYFYSLNF